METINEPNCHCDNRGIYSIHTAEWSARPLVVVVGKQKFVGAGPKVLSLKPMGVGLIRCVLVKDNLDIDQLGSGVQINDIPYLHYSLARFGPGDAIGVSINRRAFITELSQRNRWTIERFLQN